MEKPSKTSVFVRQATGLVRQVSTFDSIFLNIESNTFGLSLIYYPLVLSSFFGGSLTAASIVAALMCVPVAISYASMSTAMPRSGGDYVFISRILHPALAVASSTSMVVWFFFWTGAFSNWSLTIGASTAFQVIGSVLNNNALLNLASATFKIPYILLFGSILILGVCYISYRSTRLLFKILDVLIILGILGVVTWIVVLGTTSHAAFVSDFNSYSSHYVNTNDYYDAIINTAKNSGFSLTATSSILATLLMIPSAMYVYPYLAAQSAVGGEVKDPGRSFFRGLLLNLLISATLFTTATWVMVNTVGYNFLASIDYIFNNGLSYALPTPPYITLFAALATKNVFLQALMGIGFVCWTIGIPLINCVQVPRWLLAMSFDGVLPSKLSDISRHGTPKVGILIMAIGAEIMLIIYTLYANVLATISAAFANIAATFMVACIAAAFFPFRKKTRAIFENAPKLAKLKIGKIPLVSVAGALGAIFLGWVSLMYGIDGAYGANNLYSLLAVGGIYIGGVIIYLIARTLRKRRGIDISLAYSEIPPE